MKKTLNYLMIIWAILIFPAIVICNIPSISYDIKTIVTAIMALPVIFIFLSCVFWFIDIGKKLFDSMEK